ncbi:hypothetical protein ABT160_31895 [Streptomyces sp. NPDC001941]|uniref:hypothetical protein n=1 Tax=Streptomyces sp. NPDC001941 TaxID=3154659 RepID=UPI00331733EE
MSPNSREPGSVRSAADVNEQIRDLWLRSGGSLTPAGEAEYQRLLSEWAEAIGREVVEAA